MAASPLQLLPDLTQGVATDIGHGLVFQTQNAASGLKPLARLLERWVLHLLGVAVLIEPVHRVDVQGRPVHLGLMAQAGGTLRMKPQNLVLNLPLARSS